MPTARASERRGRRRAGVEAWQLWSVVDAALAPLRGQLLIEGKRATGGRGASGAIVAPRRSHRRRLSSLLA
jgi:hypothetical protein